LFWCEQRTIADRNAAGPVRRAQPNAQFRQRTTVDWNSLNSGRFLQSFDVSPQCATKMLMPSNAELSSLKTHHFLTIRVTIVLTQQASIANERRCHQRSV